MTTLPDFDRDLLTDFDAVAVMLHEDDMEVFWRKAAFAAFTEKHRGAKSRCASHWHGSSAPVTRLAECYRRVQPKYQFLNVGKSVVYAALECAKANEDSQSPWRRSMERWLRLAKRCKLSARQLKDKADLGRGKRVSSVPWLNGEAGVAEVIEQRAGDGVGVLLLLDEKPSGEPPKRVRVRAVEVLTE